MITGWRQQATDKLRIQTMADEHQHDHSHDHDSHESLVIEDDAGNIEAQILIDALQQVLIDKGLLSAAEVSREIVKLESPGIHLGAKIVVKAWQESQFRQALLENVIGSIESIGIALGEAQIGAVENTKKPHNLITCTRCSCYPRSILGQPPSWYISKAYRARTVREPRKVLAEFGLDLPEDVQLTIHDSNADMRYLVLPEPLEAWHDMSADDLLASVTRDHLIGVAR